MVGVDNLVAEFCLPALTTIDHRFYEMGKQAGALACELAEVGAEERGSFNDRQVTVTPQLIVRDSTGPAPQPKP